MYKICLVLCSLLYVNVQNEFSHEKDIMNMTISGEDWFCCQLNIGWFGMWGNPCVDDDVVYGFKLGSDACQVLDVHWDDSDGSTVISERPLGIGVALRVEIPTKCVSGQYQIQAGETALVQSGSCVQWVTFSKTWILGPCC